jgi:hypothetical protein
MRAPSPWATLPRHVAPFDRRLEGPAGLAGAAEARHGVVEFLRVGAAGGSRQGLRGFVQQGDGLFQWAGLAAAQWRVGRRRRPPPPT